MDAEKVVFVGPYLNRDEAGGTGHVLELGDAVLVRVLGVDGLALAEAEFRARDADHLVLQADQVHLDAAFRGVVKGVVAKGVKRESPPQLPIDAGQQVHVERRGDALGVVVGGVEDTGVLLEVDADQHGAAGPGHLGRRGEKPDRPIGGEVAQRRSREENHAFRVGHTLDHGHREGLGVIGAHDVHRQVWQVCGERRHRLDEEVARNVHADEGRRPLQGVEHNARLLAGPGAKFHQLAVRPHQGGDLGRRGTQQAGLGPRRIVFGEPADPPEQFRTLLVVKELARQVLGLVCQSLEDLGKEGVVIGGQVLERGECGTVRHGVPVGFTGRRCGSRRTRRAGRA